MNTARRQAGLSQVVVAELIGADQTCISRFELGKVPNLAAALATIGRFSKAVGCDPVTIVAPYFDQACEQEQVAS
jgi:DNA-binding XRE family transcriptional regulator